jgi:hypothetical protein
MLPCALFAYNSAFNRLTGYSPFYINQGREPNLPGQLPMSLENVSKQFEIPSRPGHYAKQLHQQLSECYALAIVDKQLKLAQGKLTQAVDIPNLFSVDDEVWLYNPVIHKDEAKVFKRYWTGSYKIIKVINPMVYEIQSLQETPRCRQIVYASRLKKKI